MATDQKIERSEGYIERIERALDFIENNLSEPISIGTVASHCGFSEYHFHRMFSAMLGESVSEYIRRRRLSRAARLIASGGASILETALESGYESQESFTRAFKTMFGLTPGRLKRLGKDALIIEKKPTTVDMIVHLREGITMEPKFVEREEELVVGMGDSFPENSFEAIGKLWERFSKRENEIGDLSGDYALGVCMQKHDDIPLGKDACFVYIAGRPVKSLASIPCGMVAVRLPRARYAVFTHTGPLSNLKHTINYIWGTWLPRSGYRQGGMPDFELYDERFHVKTMDGEVDIYVGLN